MAWLVSMQENYTCAYIHTHHAQHWSIEYGRQVYMHTDTLHGTSWLKAGEWHIYIPIYTCCTAWLNRMGEQHIYIQYTLHDMAWSNVGEQHICIHTHITQYSSVECGRAAHMHRCTHCMTSLDWMQVSAHIHTYKPYMVHLNWIWETSTYTYRHIEWHGSNE